MEPVPLNELINLSERVAVVTGGAQGIGLAIATRLAEAGASVMIANLDAEKSAAAAKTLTDRGWKAASMATDVTDEAQVEALIAETVRVFGKIDILVNNAGIYPEKPVLESTREDFEKVIHTNLMGAFFVSKAAAKQMIAEQHRGSIINVTSIDALHPSMVGLAFYDASKAGLAAFTKNLALELAPHHIWVNAIAPGAVATPGTDFWSSDTPEEKQFMEAFLAKIPMHRVAEADEVARVALFLASGLSSYMTGSQVVVDGGTLLA